MATSELLPSLTVTGWRAAPLRVEGQTLFAIGDVHGCHHQLAVLTQRFSELAQTGRSSRLIFLGDLICRGPSSLGSLQHWSAAHLDVSFEHVHRLYGNHEQLLMLSIGGGDIAKAASAKWMSIDGATFVDELKRATGRHDAPLTRDLLLKAAGEVVLERLDHLQSHVRIGNAIFVHGGVDPSIDMASSLAAPWTTFGEKHWAWIQEPFLRWRGGFGGLMVIHGHTPPPKHRKMSGYPDPHPHRLSRYAKLFE